MRWWWQPEPRRRQDDIAIAVLAQEFRDHVKANDGAHVRMVARLKEQDDIRERYHRENVGRIIALMKRIKRLEIIYYLVAAVATLVTFSGTTLGQHIIGFLVEK